jgi:hypothetical protein
MTSPRHARSAILDRTDREIEAFHVHLAKQAEKNTNERIMQPATAFLPEALMLDPAHATVIIPLTRYNTIMRGTRGRVRLFRRQWRIEARKYDERCVRVRLERE